MASGAPLTAAEELEVHPNLSAIILPREEQALLISSLANLAEFGVPVSTFTRDRVQALFMSVPQYVKQIKNLTSITDTALLGLVFESGIVSKAVHLPQRCDEKAIYKFAQWLKRGPGAEQLAICQYQIKLAKKTTAGFTAAETSYAMILEMQLQDMTAARKEIRSRAEEEISEVQKQIDRNKLTEFGCRLRRISWRVTSSSKPGRGYKPLDKSELAASSWSRFTEELS